MITKPALQKTLTGIPHTEEEDKRSQKYIEEHQSAETSR
jgi:hypothetical protein